ncbi:MAG: DNA repair protein RecO [Acholeplasmataceae bacterium]
MEGIIYKIQPYQESSRLLFVYTPIGKLTLLAKGAQKLNQKTRVISQFLTRLSFDMPATQKTFITLKNPVVIEDYQEIKNDYKMTQYAALILEIVDKFMIDIESHQMIYDEVVKALSFNDIKRSSLSFALKILKPLGYALNLSADGSVVKGVSIQKGGLVYENEAYSADLDTKDAISLLKLSYLPYNEHSDVLDDSIQRIEYFIKRYYEYHLHTTLKNLS